MDGESLGISCLIDRGIVLEKCCKLLKKIKMFLSRVGLGKSERGAIRNGWGKCE